MSRYPDIDRDALRLALKDKALMDVMAAPEGRFIVPVPDFGDGLGPLLAPNIKELEARLRGSAGEVAAIELEAGPQKIPADGTNVLVINRVDAFVQLALKAKLESLGTLDRAALLAFMSYARGYDYDPATQKITFAKNAGFHNDVYNMPVAEFTKRYENASLAPGYYVKKRLASKAAFIAGKFSVRISEAAGGTVQEFASGAMVSVPDDPAMPISFIHPTDIDACYTKPCGAPLSGLPVYDVSEFLSSPPLKILK